MNISEIKSIKSNERFWLMVVYIVYSFHCLYDSNLSPFCSFTSFGVLIFLCVNRVSLFEWVIIAVLTKITPELS